MADELTPFYGFTLPTVDDPAGEDEWGPKLNGNWAKLDTLLHTQGGVTEAPLDGQPYVRQNNAWTVSITKVDFDGLATSVGNIASDVSDLETQVTTNTNNIDALATASGLHTSQINDLYSRDSTQAGQITALQSGKEPTITAGNAAYFWAGDKTWKPVPAAGIPEAPTDGTLYGRKSSGWAPVAITDVTGLRTELDDLNSKIGINTTAIGNIQNDKVQKTGDFMTGDLMINKTTPLLRLTKAVNTPAAIVGGRQSGGANQIGLARWAISPGNEDAESGSNAGSNFYISRYSDAGGEIDRPIKIARSTGVVDFTQAPTVNGSPVGGVGPITEQFFTLDGLSNVVLTAPTWAKGVQLIGHVIMGTANASNWLNFSTDGSTFIAGSTDYAVYGPVLNAGSTGYQAFGTANQGGITLDVQGDNNNVPHMFTTDVGLVRGTTAQVFTAKTYSRMHDSAATTLGRTWSSHGWLNAAPSGSALALKALRLAPGSGVWGPGSWLRVKWFGDSATVPPANGVADAPSDGGSYVRVNGVWRKSAQSVDLTGLSTVDVTVPTGARRVSWRGNLFSSTAAMNFIGGRVSMDGTTFLTGATDYSYAGFSHFTGGTGGFQNYPVATQSTILMDLACDSLNNGHFFEGSLALARTSASLALWGNARGYSFQTAVSVAYQQFDVQQWVTTAALGANMQVQKLRFLSVNGIAFLGGAINLDWGY